MENQEKRYFEQVIITDDPATYPEKDGWYFVVQIDGSGESFGAYLKLFTDRFGERHWATSHKVIGWLKLIDLDTIKADVWDEGEKAGTINKTRYMHGDIYFVNNPYRKEETK